METADASSSNNMGAEERSELNRMTQLYEMAEQRADLAEKSLKLQLEQNAALQRRMTQLEQEVSRGGGRGGLDGGINSSHVAGTPINQRSGLNRSATSNSTSASHIPADRVPSSRRSPADNRTPASGTRRSPAEARTPASINSEIARRRTQVCTLEAPAACFHPPPPPPF
jgi:hypothetical protein